MSIMEHTGREGCKTVNTSGTFENNFRKSKETIKIEKMNIKSIASKVYNTDLEPRAPSRHTPENHFA